MASCAISRSARAISGTAIWSAIRATTGHELDWILADLYLRDVIEKQGDSRYCIRVELFKEYLLFHQ